jgi:hypothetical protein
MGAGSKAPLFLTKRPPPQACQAEGRCNAEKHLKVQFVADKVAMYSAKGLK